ncbi:MAG: hemerythrin domain-containing protein [Candidatus Omnitrophica bacterium]|nr:hemerythrin domain-containing protein [Candidatus Omnitrophota bacterium]
MTQPSIVSYYGQDHDRLDGLFKQFQAGKRSDPETAGKTYREFMAGLKRHIVWEEEILFPLFEDKTGMRDVGPTAVMRMEHQQIRGFLDAILQKVERQEAASDAEEAALLEVLSAHNQKEEQILYPLIDEHLSGAEREDVFTKMKHLGGKDAWNG